MGITDCHSQYAHWLRNDRAFAGVRADRGVRPYGSMTGSAAHIGGGVRAPRPTEALREVRRASAGRRGRRPLREHDGECDA